MRISPQCRFCFGIKTIKHGAGRGESKRRKCKSCFKTFSLGGKRQHYGSDYVAEVVHFYRHNGHKVVETLAKYPISSKTLIKWVKESGDSCSLCEDKKEV